MGILTELLRRRSGVVRSLSPTHALVAIGAHARELLENHEACLYPCGPGSPFERMLEADAKMLFFDLPFLGFTFVHYIEHQIQDRLPFPLYDPEPATARIRDFEGREREVRCFVLSEESGRRRRVDVITHEMRDEGTAYWKRLGNTEIVVARMRDALETGMRLAERGRIPFQPPSST
jgi:aminoglycoside 3-N-acetyltransferase